MRDVVIAGAVRTAIGTFGGTLADVAVMPALCRMDDLGMTDWADLPRVVTWYDNIRAQPAFKPTYYSGSLMSERFPHLRETIAKSA